MILLGENGTGKSSLINALEFFFTGNVSSFTGKGTGRLSLDEQGPHVNYKNKDIRIAAKFKDGDITRTFKHLESDNIELKRYIRSIRTSKFILKRREILDFIESTPSEFYKSLLPLLGLENINKIETSLKDSKNRLKKEYNENKEINKHYFNEISDKLVAKVNNLEGILIRLNDDFRFFNIGEISSLDELDNKTNEILKYSKNNQSEFLDGINETIRNIIDIMNSFKRINLESTSLKINENINKLIKEGTTLNQLELLYYAQKMLIKGYNNNECPLCHQEIEINELTSSIEESIEELTCIKTLKDQINKDIGNLSKDLKNLKEGLDKISSKLYNVEETEVFKSDLDNLNSKINDFRSFLNNDEIEPIDSKFIFDLNMFNEILNILEEVKNENELSESDKEFIQWADNISIINYNVKKIKDNDLKLKKSKKEWEISKSLFEMFIKIKNQKIQAIFDEIQTDLQDFYNFLHPNDPHKDVTLTIDEEKNSAYLTMTSFDKTEVNPRAYSSEGHLDSLGLCIFLSIVKHFNEDIPYLFLDDVLTTIDTNHREKFTKLLLENFPDKQIIITTHDRMWFKQFIPALKPYGLDNKFLKLEIKSWSMNHGPLFKGFKTSWENIQEKLDNGDKLCAANLGRQYLEEILDNICRNIGASLAISDVGYTVKDYIMAINSRMKQIKKDVGCDDFCIEVTKAIAKIDNNIIGNSLSHYNTYSTTVSIDEVSSFCQCAEDLRKVFSCSNCNSYLMFNSNRNELICSKKKCKKPDIYVKKDVVLSNQNRDKSVS